MLDMKMAQMVHEKRIEEEIAIRNTLIAERGIQAAIEYEEELEARREEIKARILLVVLVVVLVIGHKVVGM